jgi:hypothetical protein
LANTSATQLGERVSPFMLLAAAAVWVLLLASLGAQSARRRGSRHSGNPR